tara:strand:+ start:5046 stop:5876 length:831 start_codon:yes stop_codon:yes gene_type:complete
VTENYIENFKSLKNLQNVNQEGGYRINDEDHDYKEPLISIITATLNSEKHLEESILSLHNQKFSNYEHIIVDGNSKDNTIEIIKKYEKKISYWCSSNDKGIYDAFNKGMQLARGKYIGFLNSDDQYSTNTLEILDRYINKYPKKDFIFGAVKKHWGVLYGYKPYKIYWSWGFYSSHSTGFFIKKTSAKLVGLYNLKYKYSSDYDYFYRMIVKKKLDGIGTKKSELFGTFRRGGFSSKINFYDHFVEEIKIRLDNGQNKLLVFLIFIYKYFKNFNRL